jgi:arabinogalactan oligomer/maltooligosaccharide transport system substrate-binding protein
MVREAVPGQPHPIWGTCDGRDSLPRVIHRTLLIADGPNWGDVPSWVSAAVTLTALIFAVAAILVARRTFRLELGRDHVNSEARQRQDAFVRRSQAALVSAWWAEDRSHVAQKSGNCWGAYLRNASETPVYKAAMTVQGTGTHAKRKALEFPVVPPTKEPVFHPIIIHTGHRAADLDSSGYHLADYRISLRFTDAAGVRWARDQYGNLKELDPNLLIWTSPEAAAVIEPFTAEFLATYGVTAVLDTHYIEAELQKHFIETEPGPDILIGPHDWVGSLVKRSLIDPFTLSDERRSAFTQEHLNAVSFEGELYALPASLDTVALFRNTDVVPDPPDSMEELLATAQDLRDRNIVTELMAVPVGSKGDPFHLWPMFTSAGGWLFERRADGSWDPSRQGIGSRETLAAFDKIRVLSQLGVLRSEIDGARSLDLFQQGRAAFMLGTSGTVARIRKANLNFAISPVPPFQDGSLTVPFYSVNGFYIARRGKNKIVASDLVPDYLTRADVVEEFGRPGYVVPLRVADSCDPAIRDFHDLCSTALPMPSFPQMREVWSLLGTAEVALVAGSETEAVVQVLAEGIRKLF